MSNPQTLKWMGDIQNAVQAHDLGGFKRLYCNESPELKARALAVVVQNGDLPLLEVALQHSHDLVHLDLRKVFEKGASKGQVEATTRMLGWAKVHSTFVAQPSYAFTLASNALRSDCVELLERNWSEIEQTPNDTLNNLYGSAAVHNASKCLGFLDHHLRNAEHLRMGALSQAVRMKKAQAVTHLLHHVSSLYNIKREAGNLLAEMVRRDHIDEPDAVDTINALFAFVSFEEFSQRFARSFNPKVLHRLETMQARRQHKILSGAINDFTPTPSLARKM